MWPVDLCLIILWKPAGKSCLHAPDFSAAAVGNPQEGFALDGQVKTPNGLVMRPLQLNRWVVVFCDECNLPEEDKYGTQKVGV